MIEISVKLYSSLKIYAKTGNGIIYLSVKEGSTIQDIMIAIGIRQGESEVIRLNGNVVQELEPILYKSTIEIFPIFGGG